MRKTLLFSAALGLAVLALWSAWNPGYYYLARAAVFTMMGAGAVYLWARALGRGRYAVTGGLLYATIVLSVAVVKVELTALPGQVESINVVLIPLAAAFLLATVVGAVTARKGSAG